MKTQVQMDIPDNLNFEQPSEGEKQKESKEPAAKKPKREVFVEQYLKWIKQEVEKQGEDFGDGFWELYKNQCYILYDKYKPTSFEYFAELTFAAMSFLIIQKVVDWSEVRAFFSAFRKQKPEKDKDDNSNE